MAIRVGYRALIVDDERPAYQLAQFLMRPDLNGKVIQSFFISDKLNEAYIQAEQSDFIYIDPFSFGLAEAVNFIAEVQAHWPVKAFTLLRSGRQWQNRQRDIEGLALTPARLRTMLALDKDMMGDAAFAQAVRNNIASMEREFQQELQRTGFDPARSGLVDPGVPRVGMTDPQLPRAGTWYTVPDYAAPPPYRPLPSMDYGGAPGYGVGNLGQLTPAQLQAMIEQAVAAAARPSPTPTHPVGAPPGTPLLPAPETAQWQQIAPQLQQNVTTLQQNMSTLQSAVAALQGTQTRVQEQVTATGRELRDYSRTTSSIEQRVRDTETRLPRLDEQQARLQKNQRLALILAIVALVLGLAGLAFGLLAYLRG